MKETRKPPRRIFIGIKMPEAIAWELAKHQSRLKGLPVKLIPKRDMHLTLMPPWQETKVIAASQKLLKALRKVRAFPVTLQSLVYGPDAWRPHLVWATCEDCAELIALKKKLIKTFGVREFVPFTPHVTIARFRKEYEAAPRRMPLDIPLLIERVQLFESPHRGGTGYKELYDFHLSYDGPPH